jgi:hypothetical protein
VGESTLSAGASFASLTEGSGFFAFSKKDGGSGSGDALSDFVVSVRHFALKNQGADFYQLRFFI